MALLEKPIARRWARAVIAIAQDKNALKDVGEDLDALAVLMGKMPELRMALLSPAFRPEQRRAILTAILDEKPAGHPAHEITRAVVAHVVEKDRVPYLPLIAEMYRREADRLSGRIRAQVWSAQELSKDELVEITRALEKQAARRELGREVVVTAGVDPTLLAGVKASLGGVVFDGTLRNHLRRMGQQLAPGA